MLSDLIFFDALDDDGMFVLFRLRIFWLWFHVQLFDLNWKSFASFDREFRQNSLVVRVTRPRDAFSVFWLSGVARGRLCWRLIILLSGPAVAAPDGLIRPTALSSNAQAIANIQVKAPFGRPVGDHGLDGRKLVDARGGRSSVFVDLSLIHI